MYFRDFWVFQGFYKEKRGLGVGLAGGKGFSVVFLSRGKVRA